MGSIGPMKRASIHGDISVSPVQRVRAQHKRRENALRPGRACLVCSRDHDVVVPRVEVVPARAVEVMIPVFARAFGMVRGHPRTLPTARLADSPECLDPALGLCRCSSSPPCPRWHAVPRRRPARRSLRRRPLLRIPRRTRRPGPYSVGFTRLHLSGGRNVVVWYPALPGASTGHAEESIDIAGMLTPELQAKVPAADRVLYNAKAYENAPAASTPGNYPLVVFSHGFAGYPEQSVTLTSHLASWGFVVVAPDHVERSLDGLLGTATNGVPQMTDLAVLQSTLDLVERASTTTGVLKGLVDPNRVVAVGHSTGAGAAYRSAGADPASRRGSPTPSDSGIGAFAKKAPSKPGMVMLGTTDGIIAPAKSVQVYNAMQSPKYLVKISKAGHLVFSDICLIARDKGGITGIAKAIKLPIPQSLLKLGSDGCESTHPLASTAFPGHRPTQRRVLPVSARYRPTTCGSRFGGGGEPGRGRIRRVTALTATLGRRDPRECEHGPDGVASTLPQNPRADRLG